MTEAALSPQMQEQLSRLLGSGEPANVELAFQILQGLDAGVVQQFRSQLTGTGYKVAFCLRYGFWELLAEEKQLFIYEEPFRQLPPEIGKLAKLEVLEMRRNGLNSLPPQIAHLSRLQSLDLAENHLEELPPQIFHLQYLTRLSVQHNRLRSLPSSIGDLPRLQILTLAHNQLRELPLELSRLPALEVLDVRHNRLTRLPEELIHAPQLRYLYLGGNPALESQWADIKRILPNVRLLY